MLVGGGGGGTFTESKEEMSAGVDNKASGDIGVLSQWVGMAAN